MRAWRVPLSTVALLLATAFHVGGQSVVSTHSGVIYFFEGSVFNGDQRLEQKFGQFPDVPQGGELRTADGRVEVLLTPGVFLRLDENAAIRMISNQLSDTLVELLAGSAIVESDAESPDTSVTMIYQKWRIRVPRAAVYRIESQSAQVRVYKGNVDITADLGEEPVAAGEGEVLRLADVLAAEPAAAPEDADTFKAWAMNRSQAVSSDNAIAAEIFEDPEQIDASGLARGGFSHFPMTGIPALGISNPYGVSFWSPYQSTLNAIYSPVFLYGLRYPGWLTRLPVYSPPIGIGPSRAGTGTHPVYAPPRFPVTARPIGPSHGAPHAGFHGGGRR